MKKRWTIVLGLLAGVFVACTPAPAKGILQIDITAPSGVTPNVAVSGPSGFAQTLNASAVLSDAEVGSYTIVANDFTATSGAVYGGTVSGSPATVVADTKSTVTVTYTLKTPATGNLTKRMYASGDGDRTTTAGGDPNNGVLYLTPTDLNGAGGTAPSVSPQFKRNAGIFDVVFDSVGNQYQGSKENSATLNTAGGRQTVISGYTKAVADSNTSLSDVRITITNGHYANAARTNNAGFDYSLYDPTDLALNNDNLWAIDPQSTARYEFTDPDPTKDARTIVGRLVCYAKANLDAAAAKNSIEGAGTSTINTPGIFFFGTVITGAKTMAFDKNGNLWVAGPNRLARIKSSSLGCTALTATLTPVAKQITAADLDINYTIAGLNATDIAVETGANPIVWLANGTNIVKVNYSNTTTPSSANITVTGSSTGLSSAVLDANNKLWVGVNTSATAGKILLLPANPSGAIAAEKTFATGFGVGSLIFQP